MTPLEQEGQILPEPEQPIRIGYHADFQHVSRSQLALFCESRIDCYRQYVSRERGGLEDNDALRVGTGTHAVALRDALAIRNMVEVPASALDRAGKRAGNAWVKFRLKNQGKTLLLPKQFQLCRDLAEALELSPVGDILRHPEARRELEHRWSGAAGLKCRLKADLVLPGLDEVVCVDVKTARSIHPRAFRSEVKHRLLWLQDAHYSEGLEDLYGLPVRFVFAAVRKSWPHRVKVFELTEGARIAARRRYRVVMGELAECYRSGAWGDQNDDMIEQIELSEADLGGELS